MACFLLQLKRLRLSQGATGGEEWSLSNNTADVGACHAKEAGEWSDGFAVCEEFSFDWRGHGILSGFFNCIVFILPNDINNFGGLWDGVVGKNVSLFVAEFLKSSFHSW